jgi:hypothetical protein
VARFCPRCGFHLTDDLHPFAATPAAADRRAWMVNLSNWKRLRQAVPPPVPAFAPGRDVRPLVLVGFANAMYNLGWRYEKGYGSRRNADEAMRCYFKAAKLGNSGALARLAPQCMAPAAQPESIPPAIVPFAAIAERDKPA